jgi:hypothetical protein
MLYRKNVGAAERVLRSGGGLLGAATSFVMLGFTPLGWALALSGACLAVTGFIGFCPACALVGRRLPQSR